MKRSILYVSVLLIIFGCAPYKQLKPKIELSPAESGYIELKKDEKNNFALKKDDQYFIVFPAPKEEHFYLVLTIKDDPVFKSALTASLVKNKTPGERIEDESPGLDTECVYTISPKAPTYFWLLENVKADQDLKLTYRYVPKWRYKFENKHDEYKQTLEKNRVDRATYDGIGTKHHFEAFKFDAEKETLKSHTASLDTVLQALLAIESIFPKSIINSSDEAYQNYLKLKKALDEEIAFQKLYWDVLDFFHIAWKTQNDVPGLVDHSARFIEYFGNKSKFAKNVLDESQAVLKKRLDEVPPYYDRLLKTKDDASPFDVEKFRMEGFVKIAQVYEVSGVKPSNEFIALDGFMKGFDARARELDKAIARVDETRKTVKNLKNMPSQNFFTTQAAGVSEALKEYPKPIDAQFGDYAGLACSKALNDALAKSREAFDELLAQYRQAEGVVSEVDPLLVKLAYPEALGIVMQYKNLTFLLEKYKALDKLSVEAQKERTQDALQGMRWSEAEQLLSRLHTDQNFIEPPNVAALKMATVSNLEDTLYMQIDKATRYRVMRFLDDNQETFENVDSLYVSPVFLPVHEVTFTSGGKTALYERKNELVQHLAQMKDFEFPAKAVKILYDKFVKDPGADGVLRARAIVSHGGHYKGDDDKTKRMIAECDPYASKWIVNPTQYRRVFVVPVTSKRSGENRYFFRLNIRIPTDAKFPVYDVNIKLPKEIAESAGEKQWYEKIMLNKDLLKNEGRFTISAPTAASDWECQVTPVRMLKDENNFLDVYFTHNSFKVHQVSVMVQKPIIKKN